MISKNISEKENQVDLQFFCVFCVSGNNLSKHSLSNSAGSAFLFNCEVEKTKGERSSTEKEYRKKIIFLYFMLLENCPKRTNNVLISV